MTDAKAPQIVRMTNAHGTTVFARYDDCLFKLTSVPHERDLVLDVVRLDEIRGGAVAAVLTRGLVEAMLAGMAGDERVPCVNRAPPWWADEGERDTYPGRIAKAYLRVIEGVAGLRRAFRWRQSERHDTLLREVLNAVSEFYFVAVGEQPPPGGGA